MIKYWMYSLHICIPIFLYVHTLYLYDNEEEVDNAEEGNDIVIDNDIIDGDYRHLHEHR